MPRIGAMPVPVAMNTESRRGSRRAEEPVRSVELDLRSLFQIAKPVGKKSLANPVQAKIECVADAERTRASRHAYAPCRQACAV